MSGTSTPQITRGHVVPYYPDGDNPENSVNFVSPTGTIVPLLKEQKIKLSTGNLTGKAKMERHGEPLDEYVRFNRQMPAMDVLLKYDQDWCSSRIYPSPCEAFLRPKAGWAGLEYLDFRNSVIDHYVEFSDSKKKTHGSALINGSDMAQDLFWSRMKATQKYFKDNQLKIPEADATVDQVKQAFDLERGSNEWQNESQEIREGILWEFMRQQRDHFLRSVLAFDTRNPRDVSPPIVPRGEARSLASPIPMPLVPEHIATVKTLDVGGDKKRSREMEYRMAKSSSQETSRKSTRSNSPSDAVTKNTSSPVVNAKPTPKASTVNTPVTTAQAVEASKRAGKDSPATAGRAQSVGIPKDSKVTPRPAQRGGGSSSKDGRKGKETDKAK